MGRGGGGLAPLAPNKIIMGGLILISSHLAPDKLRPWYCLTKMV